MEIRQYGLILLVGVLFILPFGCTTVTSQIVGEKDCMSKCDREFRRCNSRCYERFISSTRSVSCAEKCNEDFNWCKQLCPDNETTSQLERK